MNINHTDQGGQAAYYSPDYLQGEVIVRLHDGNGGASLGDEAMASLRASLGAELVSSTQQWGFQLWRFDGVSTDVALDQLQASGVAEYADTVQPNYVLAATDMPADVEASATFPNDPRFGSQWGLHNTGGFGATADADIDAPEAWDVSTGAGAVVAVIDSGVDYNHPDLKNNMWVNKGEIPGNRIDDDKNGYVDDYYGYDFANNDGNPLDDFGHGTYVAGTVAADGNNGIGMTGVAPNAKIMALKFMDANGSGSTFNAIQALEYATLMGADVSNNSWGGGGYYQNLYDAITLAGQAGHVFVAAAGNGGPDQIGDNNDRKPFYPSSYPLSNLISVAASDKNDSLTSFSNFGVKSVDLAAPGEQIWSTAPGGRYGVLGGTSMATPHVTGAVALLMASEPGLSASAVRNRILDNVDPIPELNGITVSGGRLNAANALSAPQPGSIAGTVWNDADNDGIRDQGESGMHGWNVYLDANGNGNLDRGEVSAMTNGSGRYTFSNVSPGIYHVEQVMQSGWTQTAPSTFNLVTVSNGSASTGANFGNHSAGSGGGGGGSPTNDNLVGTGHNNVFNGGAGNDNFLLRYGDDIATGGPGADTFNIDGRYINDGDDHRITDLNFGEGDTLVYRLFNPGSFDNSLDPTNHLFVNSSGQTAAFNSIADIVEAHRNGVLQATGSNDGDTLLTISSKGEEVSVELDGLRFAALGLGGGGGGGSTPPPTSGSQNFIGSRYDDVMVGSVGDDQFLLRYSNDTVTGDKGADIFKIDGRYVYDKDAHTITDLDFAQGDMIEFRFMNCGTFDNDVDPWNDLRAWNNGGWARFDSVEDIVEADANGVITAADDGFGGTILSLTVGGQDLSLTLQGWDIV